MPEVKLPREIDKAINTLRMGDISDYGIIALTSRPSKDEFIQKLSPAAIKALTILRSWTFSDMDDEDEEWKLGASGPAKADKLIKCLVNGYEVEKTPEEKVREFFQLHYEFGNNTSNGPYGHLEDRIKYETVLTVLNMLGIKIEG